MKALGSLDHWPHKMVFILFVFFTLLSIVMPPKKKERSAASSKADSNTKTKSS